MKRIIAFVKLLSVTEREKKRQRDLEQKQEQERIDAEFDRQYEYNRRRCVIGYCWCPDPMNHLFPVD